MSEVTAFILAGGKSSRMGEDKAFLKLCGQTLLRRTLRLVSSITANVYVVGDRQKFSEYARVAEDIYTERGPLGGIHAGLSITGTELNLMLAVDLPFMRAEFLRHMIQRAHVTGATVTVPQVHGYLQPLCAVYHRRFLGRAAEALQQMRNKIDVLFSPEDTLIIEEAELAKLSFPPGMFDNLNTREQYRRAQAAMDGLPE